jgi:hypothetical protein
LEGIDCTSQFPSFPDRGVIAVFLPSQIAGVFLRACFLWSRVVHTGVVEDRESKGKGDAGDFRAMLPASRTGKGSMGRHDAARIRRSSKGTEVDAGGVRAMLIASRSGKDRLTGCD